jgi:DNA-binding transcriptional MerR regulator
MTEWRIKEISDLTKISIRMLRHYDKIGLLKPSYRAANGYRCYTASDLAKLQQIIALRYFGFNLSSIKTILQKHQNIYAHLQAQQQVLREQSQHLQQVHQVLGDVLKRLLPAKTPDWSDLINLIEGYQMTNNLREKLKKTWAAQFSEEQFEEYLSTYEQFPNEFAERDKIIEKINNGELGDPSGKDGEHVAKFLLDLAKKMKATFTKQVKFNSSLLADIQSGKISQLQTTPEGTLWLSRAMLFYWLNKWNSLNDIIVENLSADPEGKIGKKIASEWNDLINEYFEMGNKSFIIGTIMWNELAKQEQELQGLSKMPTPQEMIKKVHVKLFFNPEATSWISRALEVHIK